jgi:hypothetical protein
MSFLSLNIGILAFADAVKSQQPDIRLADIKWSLQGLQTNSFKQIPVSLAPGETLTLASTSRTLNVSNSQLVITKKESTMRIAASIGQAVVKNAGDATTLWSFTKSHNGVCKLEATGGTIPNLSLVSAGSILELKNPFSVRNQGQFLILKSSSTSVEFINELASSEASSVTAGVDIFTKNIQVGDILDITASEVAFPNRGSFPVSKVGADYIELVNPSAFPETATGVSSGIVAYPFAYKWVMAAVDRKVLMGLNGSSPSAIEIEPPVEEDIVKNPGLFIKRGRVFEVTMTNTGIQQVSGFLILAE